MKKIIIIVLSILVVVSVIVLYKIKNSVSNIEPIEEIEKQDEIAQPQIQIDPNEGPEDELEFVEEEIKQEDLENEKEEEPTQQTYSNPSSGEKDLFNINETPIFWE